MPNCTTLWIAVYMYIGLPKRGVGNIWTEIMGKWSLQFAQQEVLCRNKR